MMNQLSTAALRSGLATALVVAAGFPRVAAAQFPPDSFTNLKVLPKDIGQRELVAMMAGFTRALGVRCQFCHVGEEGQPLSKFDFPSDEKETKRKARVMLRMVQHINGEHLGELGTLRSDPPIEVTCATCHHGVNKPRPIQDLLVEAYQAGGLDSTMAAYSRLREANYGSYAYDFSEIVLPDVAQRVLGIGRLSDAVVLLRRNVELFPKSVFAQRMYADRALEVAFREQGIPAGIAQYREFQRLYSMEAFPEFLLNGLGYRLLLGGHVEEAIEVFKLNVEAYPASFNTYDSLGEAYMTQGDRKLAVENYEKSLELNPDNTNGVEMLKKLRGNAAK